MTWSTTALRARARRSLIRALGRAHRTVIRLGGGRVLGHVAGMPVLLLTTRGRHTGKRRTVPLTYLRDGVDLVVVGSFGGSDRPPAWYLNLEHDPRATVEHDGVTVVVSARTADAEERTRLWPVVIDTNQGYARYQARTSRRIPIVLLTPSVTAITSAQGPAPGEGPHRAACERIGHPTEEAGVAVAYIQEFPFEPGDLGTANYDAVAAALDLTTAPEGLIVHTAGFDHADGVFRIFDVWETREAGERFVQERLNPILERFMAEAPEGDFVPPTLDSWYDLHDTIR